jgi:hypothetical protein
MQGNGKSCSVGGWLIGLVVVTLLVAIAVLVIVSIDLSNTKAQNAALLSSAKSSDTAALLAQSSKLAQTLAGMQGAVTPLQAQFNNLAQTLSGVQNAVSALKTTDPATLSTLSALQTQNAQALKSLAQLQSQVNGLPDAVAEAVAAPPVTPSDVVYPGLTPVAPSSSPPCSLTGAFISQDKVCVIDGNRVCTLWNPAISGCGAALLPLTIAIPMSTADDLIAQTTDTQASISISFSGGDLAVKACLPTFTFTLLASTPDANGDTGLGGYYWSTGAVYIPAQYAPASVNYTALPLTSSPANVKLYANFFADGSLRVTGAQCVAIPSGTYVVQPACIIYNARKNPYAAPKNVLVSDSECISDVGPVVNAPNPVQLNFETYVGNYYEYFPIDYYNGHLYIVGNENCYPASNAGAPFFQYALLSSYYHLQYTGSPSSPLTRVSYVPTLDGTLSPDSVTVFAYNNVKRLTRLQEVLTNQQEAGIGVSRQHPSKMAVVHDSGQVSQAKGGWQLGFSTDAGVSWDMNSISISVDAGVPDGLVLMPPGHQNYSFTCSVDAGSNPHCPARPGDPTQMSGWEYVPRVGNFPNSCGDNRMAVDALDQFWQVGLYCVGEYQSDIANVVVTMSPDYGQTWYLAANIAMANVTAYSYDYPVVAAGSDGAGGALFCVSIKVDSDLSELLAFGTTQPVELNCFRTRQRGQLATTYRATISGSYPGHYGGMDIGKDGTIYYVQQGMQGSVADPFTGQVLASSFGPYGSNNLANAPLIYTKCSVFTGTISCVPMTIIARVDNGYTCPTAQPFRCTWSHPSVHADKYNNVYVLYYDVGRNPLATADAYANFINANQNMRIVMIKSPDGGKTWSPPQTINDDSAAGDALQPQNVRLNLVTHYDPVTHSIAVSWIDTRPDPVYQSGTQIYAAIVQL